MNEWDVVSQEPAPRAAPTQPADVDPWAVVQQSPAPEEVQRPTGLSAAMSGLQRGARRTMRGFSLAPDTLILAGESAERRPWGDIGSSIMESLRPGTEPTIRGDVVDAMLKGAAGITRTIGRGDALDQRRDEARQAQIQGAVDTAIDMARYPSSEIAERIQQLDSGSVAGDIMQAGEILAPGWRESLGRIAFGATRGLPGIVSAMSGEADTFSGIPSYIAELSAESLPGSIPGIAASMAGGALGGPGGAAAAGGATFGLSSMLQQYGGGIIDYLSGQGYNISNPDTVAGLLSDPEILDAALEYAGVSATTQAPYEAVAGAIGPAMLVPRRALANNLAREIANSVAAQPLAQGTVGAMGEKAAAEATGEDFNIVSSLIANVLGEAGMSATETVGARGAARSRAQAEASADAARAQPAPSDAMGSTRPEAPAAGAGDGSGVQSEQTPSAAMSEPDLTPRAPATPTIEEGVTREQLVEEWRNAGTPDERAAAAARIAAYDAQRDDAGAADAGPVDADGAAGAGAAQEGLQGEGRQAPEQAPRSEVRNAAARQVADRYEDTQDAAITAALGPAARGITVHNTIADLHPDDQRRINITEEDVDVEGFYDPDTGRVHIFEGNLVLEGEDTDTGRRWSMTRDQRRAWVAAHERAGHAGVRGMFASAEGSNAAGAKALSATLRRAEQNPTIAAIVRSMKSGQRPETGPILIEEAIVEVAAAVRTGDYSHIEGRYGVTVPEAQRATLRGFIERLIESIRRAFGKVGEGMPDSEIYRLIQNANRHARTGEVRGTSRRAERSQGPVAQRAFHGTPHRGIERFSLDRVGTGEGNQAYGWGLYFASMREVADHYRTNLTKSVPTSVSWRGRNFRGGTPRDSVTQALSHVLKAATDNPRDNAVGAVRRALGRLDISSMGYDHPVVRALQDMQASAPTINRNSRGSLYAVEIPEDSDLLDYDAPLSQQPERVREAVIGVMNDILPSRRAARLIDDDATGGKIYNELSREIAGDEDADSESTNDRAASEALNAAGIPGLRYLDGVSRRDGDGSRNYVIWNEEFISEPEAIIASRASSLLKNLTPAERKKVTDKVAAKIEAQLTKLPPKREMAAVAVAGQAKRGWYRQSAETISAVFGPDAPLFAGLLAATSPQISVEGNLKNALSIWRDWVAAGRPTDEDAILDVMRSSLRRSFGNSLRAWEPNTVRALQGQGILSGPKVDSFMRNLLGDVEEVTNDAWMANFANVSQTIFKGSLNVRGTDPGKGAGYLAMNARVREVARELTRMTGEQWTPAEVQETIWSWAKTITEMADSAGEIRSAEELVLDRAVTDELIASTPDFGTLFTMPEYRQILEDAGYGEQLNSIDAQRDAARQAGKESGARRQAGPFAEEDQLRLERRAARRIDNLRRSRAEGAAVEEESADEVPFSRAAPGRFQPLPGAPKIKGATGPDKRLVRIAERYAKANGIELRRQAEYVAADPERGARIAEAYEAMEHAPNDPAVREAYENLIRQTTAQYRALEEAGYRFWFTDPDNDPYEGNPWNAMRDLRANQSMGVFPTDAGFGSGATDIDVSDNPLMADTGIRWPFGSLDGELRPVLANDLFRAVHDAFGHGLEGAGFRADGEENAWQAHVRLFTGSAVGAITTETRGQNSWLNFGPYGESNRTARVEDTVFADQKTGLLPEWVWSEGRADDESYVVASRAARAPATRVRDAVPGRGSGPVASRRRDSGRADRGVHPDAAVTLNIGLSTAELRGGGELSRARVMRVLRRTGATVLADSRHVSDSEPTLVVDLDRPLTAEEGNEVSAALDQQAIVQRSVDGSGELFGPMAEAWGPYNPKLFVMPDGDRADRGPVASRARNPQVDTPEFRRWFGDSKVVDENGDPLVVYHGTGATFTEFNTEDGTGDSVGAYFSEERSVASYYAERRGGQVLPVYLSLQNPLVLPSSEFPDIRSGDVSAEERAELEAAGYDGIIGRQFGWREFVAFRPGQIKSATGNSGAFDPSDPSIIASRGRRTATGRRGRTARAFSGKPRQPDAVSADAYHYSNTPGLTELDPTFAGTAGAGRERRAFGMGRFGERGGTYARLNFYVREPGAPVPGAEDVVRGAGGSNLYRVQLDNLYDLDNDPRGIVADAGPNVTLMEEEIAAAGFDGFLAGPQPGIDTPVAVVFDLPGTVPVENVDGSQPLPQQQAEPEWGDPNDWLAQYEARRRGPVASRGRRTAADARRERGKLFGRLAADGYRMGSPTQTTGQTGGRFATVKQARDAALIALHDKMLPLLRAQQQVAEDGRGISSITLDDAMNAYRAENLMHGAVNDELTGLHYRHIRPIQEAIRKSPYSVDMFEDYLYAKAAPERNREIAKINKAMPDAGSGITTQMAKDIMAGKADGVFSGKRLTPEAIALFDDLNKHVRALRDAALNNMIDAGQITPELAASLRKKYPNYVPMRGKDAELDEGRGSRPGTGRGLSQRRANIRRALGRGADNVPVNILGELVGDAQRSVVAKGKAKVARAMLRFALANPNPDLYTVEPVDLEWRFSEATGEAYLGVKRRGEDVDTSMVIMHKGNPVYLRFNDPQLAAAMLNAGVEDMGKMMRVFSALNRWRSAALTRYNPAFTPVNMARDFHFGTVAIAAEHGPRIAAQAVMNYPSAMRASYRHAAGRRGDSSKPDSEKTMQDWAAEAYATGMSTGITHTPNVVDLQRNLQAATMGVMELAASGRPLAATGQALYRAGRPIIDAIENANEASENAIRLGVYVALRKDGMSKTRAAEYAKNVTINFNRKGKAGPILNAIFLFYNAAMQGGHAVLRVMRDPKVMTYLIGLSVMQGLLSAGLMDDDDGDGITEWDKIPDYVKRTSLIFPLSEGKYFAMPMPYGFNWFTYLGGRGTQRMILGDRPTDSSIMVDLAKSLSEAFSPIPFEDGYRSLFGDQVGLAMGLAANRDDFGSPIAQLNPYEQYPEPRALQGRVTTPGMYHVMAQLMAKAGGGDLDERLPPIGWLDVAPEQIEELVNHFGGGITSLSNRGLRAFEQMQAGNLDGAFEVLSAAPITSRLLVSPSEARAIADRYYSERGEFARHKAIVDNRIAQGMPLDEAIADRPPEYFTGAQQATYQRHGRRQDGTRYRRGEGRVDSEGNPIIEYTEGSPRDVLKSANRRVSALNEAVREIRAATITNAELAEMYAAHYDAHTKGLGQVGAIDGVTGRPADIGLPDDFDGDATAPARVRNRAIKILQDMRAEEQRRLLRSIEYERKLQSVRR